MSSENDQTASSTIEVTALCEADVAPVMRLYQQSIGPVWIENGRDHDLDRIAQNIGQHLEAPNYWMSVVRPAAEPTAALLGYLAWEKHDDHTSKHIVAHLRMLLVSPDQQGSGLGQLLMTRFEDATRAAGCTKIMFDVVVGSAARGFYAKLGYRHWSDYLEKEL